MKEIRWNDIKMVRNPYRKKTEKPWCKEEQRIGKLLNLHSVVEINMFVKPEVSNARK